ncbi:MAG: 16S rRNA (adenine(1518)-N(6)/adenine(1519)-N(6))-dimethyltransferase RsmA [Saprospiraceae bacterium]|nr:ribosomal RNA small subunit methyltransferase A [Saprospiraceae bacterium]MBK9565824.1 ribosomal RNA small subunit methyltransferase A [Saprospiraceae bacterium]MBP6447035.1 ribosomal RNA small subunit methyltransferase A [Saprospiraceae bacterium]
MKAKKSFGQHFLVNEHIAEQIAEGFTKVTENANVLEIGPGKGVLTKYLNKKNTHLKVVEADQDMVHYLIKNQIVPNEDIIFLDFLKLNLSKVFDNEEFYLIGNYPYNISSQILIKMINSRELVPEMVGMFQKEVADRVVAPPGSKTYGVISVLVQAYYEGVTIIDVPPHNFSPPPRVNSSVIRLVRKEKYELPCDERLFRNVVKTSFNGRRKMLRNTLKPLFKQSDILEDVFFTQRPEQLSVSDFVDITIKLSNINNNNSEI